MDSRYRPLGVPGSLRAGASSTAILTRLAEALASAAEFSYASIRELPHFNQDLYVEPLPMTVSAFREQIEAANGLVISSPEYSHGIPGVLKNALDWALRPHNRSPLRNKSVLVISSSLAFTGGVRAQHQIREILCSALARPVNTPELVIGEIHRKVKDGRFEDPATIGFVRNAFATMFKEIERRPVP